MTDVALESREVRFLQQFAPATAELLTISIQDTPAGGTLHIDWGTTRASIPFTVG